MYQLRNRYNLEKRKVESLRNEGIRSPKSSWPLFAHLTFLDGHIRPRKSYKSMMKRCKDDEDDYLPGDFGMPMVEIKFERNDQLNDVSDLFPCDYET